MMLSTRMRALRPLVKLPRPALGRFATGSHYHADNPDVIENAKEKSKKGDKWVPEAASDSEAAVKADRGETDHMDVKQLQEESLKMHKDKK